MNNLLFSQDNCNIFNNIYLAVKVDCNYQETMENIYKYVTRNLKCF